MTIDPFNMKGKNVKVATIAFGRRCLNMILIFDTPKAFAANTYSKFLALKNSALTTPTKLTHEKSNKISPNNYYTLKNLLNLYLFDNNAKLDLTLDSFYSLDPTNPTIHNDLVRIYSIMNKQADLISFYKAKLKVSGKDQELQGNLYFLRNT